MEEWAKTDPEVRKAAEAKMQSDWQEWATSHKDAVQMSAGLGKTKVVSSEGVADGKNDLMLYSVVEAENQDAAAEMFEGHPHFGIPGATIEIMTSKPI
ncbi:MAG: YCII-related domain protein [Parcubacteria group bacterium]|nr:YCII-related domain protein [Parcubacteria group bacterium]